MASASRKRAMAPSKSPASRFLPRARSAIPKDAYPLTSRGYLASLWCIIAISSTGRSSHRFGNTSSHRSAISSVDFGPPRTRLGGLLGLRRLSADGFRFRPTRLPRRINSGLTHGAAIHATATLLRLRLTLSNTQLCGPWVLVFGYGHGLLRVILADQIHRGLI